MAWNVKRDDRCPIHQPWGVVDSDTNELVGHHPDRGAAEMQKRALEVSRNQLARDGGEYRVSPCVTSPVGKPYAVIRNSDDKVMGWHATRDDAVFAIRSSKRAPVKTESDDEPLTVPAAPRPEPMAVSFTKSKTQIW